MGRFSTPSLRENELPGLWRSPPPCSFTHAPHLSVSYVRSQSPHLHLDRTRLCMRHTTVFTLILAIVCMPYIARPLISATRSVITRSPLRARAAGISLPFGLFASSSSSPQQNQNSDNMSVQKSDSEWQAQLSPEQVSRMICTWR